MTGPTSLAHVAVDVRMARDSGIGTYIRNVLPAVITARPDWRFTLLGRRAMLADIGFSRLPNVAIRDCSAPIYSIREQLTLPVATPRDADLFWAPHYNIPLFHPGRLVVTVHDVFHLAMPELVPGAVRRAYARAMFAAVQRRATAVITVSEFSRAEYRRVVGKAGAEPVVIPNGVGREWLEAIPADSTFPEESTPYVLFVGNVKPHKNLGALVRAFALLATSLPHDLVIVGRRSGLRGADLTVTREAAGLGSRVRFAGEVDDVELRRLVRGASAMVFPSLYEGFGLPPLEAMAVGCPTLVARSGALPETCGDATLYCDPRDAADIARQLHRVLTDEGLRAELRRKGREHVRAFTWERAAVATVGVLEGAL